MKKRLIAWLLVVVIVLTSYDVSVMAVDSGEKIITANEDAKLYIPGEGGIPTEEQYKGFVESLLYPRTSKTKSIRNPLTGMNRKVYDVLKAYIIQTANGERNLTIYSISLEELGLKDKKWTAEDLGVDALVKEGSISEEAMAALGQRLGINISIILDVLLADCPYEMYWFDKTNGASGPRYSVSCDYETIWIATDLKFSFYVSTDYKTGECELDSSEITTVKTAVENAKAIVAKYKDKRDYERLDGYRQEICDLVSYNRGAAEDIHYPYGDPWQLIYVFDKDSSTTVVCEGYSKAFQYLCDLSTFNNSNVNCVSVTGDMISNSGSSGHMWNIVTMGDNKNYLVDVTNCDEGTIGASSQLFLMGYSSGSVGSGYTYKCNGGNVKYVYDTDTLSIYDQAQLTLSPSKYEDGSEKEHKLMKTEKVEATCTQDGNREYWYCSLCKKYFSDANADQETTIDELILPAYHVEVIDEAVEPTCETDGLTEGSHCERCKKVLVKQEVVGHRGHKYGREVVTKATFDKEGVKTRTCENCGNQRVAPIAKVSRVSLSTAVYTYDGKVKNPTVEVKDAAGNKLNTKDYEVAYEDGRKNIGQYTVTVTLKNNYSGTKNLTFAIQPKATTSVTANLSSYNAVRVTWKKVANVSGYRVFYKQANEKDYIASKTATGTSVTITGLKSGVKYDFKVVACYKADGVTVDSTAGKTTNMTTLKKVSTPVVEKVSNTKIRVKWDNVAGESGYQISRSTSKRKTSILSTYGTTTGSSKIFTTTKNKNYYYKVRAYKTVNGKKIYGPWSDATAYALRSVSKVAGAKVVLSRDYNRVKFSWKKASGANRYYLYLKEGNGTYAFVGTTTGTSKYIDGLKPGVTYTFKVVPAYVSGDQIVAEGKSSTSKITTLQKLNAPKVTRSSAKKVKVSWNNIAGESGYQISRSTSTTGTSIVSTYGTTSGKSKTVSATKNKTYYYKVRAYKTVSGKKIYGPWSEVTEYINK